MARVKVSVRNDQNEVRVPVGIRMLIRRCCQAVLVAEGFNRNSEVSVSFVSNEEIRRLNLQFRNKDASTDVLSFPLKSGDVYEVNKDTGAVVHGDIVISLETAVKQADFYGHSLEREIGFLTVHSMFHLLGYDHEEGSLEERIMREKEEAVLEILGIPRDTSYIQGDVV